MSPPESASDERPVDVDRYLSALRRGAGLIAVIVLPLTVSVLALSLMLPKTYKSTARLVLQDQNSTLQTSDAESQRRRLATIQTLLTSPDVLRAAARRVPGETAETLSKKVSASVSATANIIDVKATDGDAEGAADNANAVARTFITRQRARDRAQLASARRGLEVALGRLRGRSGAAGQIRALEDRLSALGVSEVTPGDDLQVAETARPPSSPDSPRPLQNTVFAFFGALFLAVLAAIGRAHLAPRVSGPRELGKLVGAAPLVSIPDGRRSHGREREDAYQALQASLSLRLEPTQRVVLVTSALPGEGKDTLTIGLAAAMARAGESAVVVAADLHDSRLHADLDIPQAPGLTELLDATRDGRELSVAGVVRSTVGPHGEPLSILPGGSRPRHLTRLLAGDAVGEVLGELRHGDAARILVDGPPMLGGVDGQLLAQWVDAILVVSRVDRLSPADADELGRVLEGLGVPVVGVVAIGGRRTVAYTPTVARRSASDLGLSAR